MLIMHKAGKDSLYAFYFTGYNSWVIMSYKGGAVQHMSSRWLATDVLQHN